MHKAVCLVLLLAMLSTGCTKDHTRPAIVTAATIQECSGCTDTFSFKRDIVPILTGNCSVPGCHDYDDQAGGLELDSARAYISLTTTPLVVNPGNAAKSLFYEYLVPGGAEEMPQNNFPLDSCDINKIYCWIQQGAMNN